MQTTSASVCSKRPLPPFGNKYELSKRPLPPFGNKYELYRGLLEMTEPDRFLFLAVSDLGFNSFFQREAIQLIIRRNQVRLLIIDMQCEEIVQWIR
jgi:hypothetical protein